MCVSGRCNPASQCYIMFADGSQTNQRSNIVVLPWQQKESKITTPDVIVLTSRIINSQSWSGGVQENVVTFRNIRWSYVRLRLGHIPWNVCHQKNLAFSSIINVMLIIEIGVKEVIWTQPWKDLFIISQVRNHWLL